MVAVYVAARSVMVKMTVEITVMKKDVVSVHAYAYLYITMFTFECGVVNRNFLSFDRNCHECVVAHTQSIMFSFSSDKIHQALHLESFFARCNSQQPGNEATACHDCINTYTIPSRNFKCKTTNYVSCM